MTSRRRALAAAALSVVVAGCALNPPPTPTPPRASTPAGQVYAPFTRFLETHPQRHRAGMTYGILVSVTKLSAFCALNGCTWSGTVVVPGARIEEVSSHGGDDGMASLVSPGDLFCFPAGGPVDAPSDDGGTLPVKVIIAGAVKP